MVGPIVAFPGAVGFGASTPGGRGGAVLFVTNLNDSGPGSLRAALTATGPRTILFRVGGTIALDSTITVRNSNVTIAGQTAPGGGIALRHSGIAGFGEPLVSIATHDVIIRHVRFRRGPSAEGECCGDNLSLNGASDVIVDHCSFSFSTDESFELWPAQRVTVQWSLFSEQLGLASHQENGVFQSHSYAMIAGDTTRDLTVYRNYFANDTGRNPRIDPVGGGDFQLINNIVHNTCYAATLAGSGGIARYNAISNLIKNGPNTCGSGRASLLPEGMARVYVQDNFTPYRTASTQDEWMATAEFQMNPPASAAFRSTTQFPMPTLPTVPSSQLAAVLLPSVGATLPTRDSLDARAVADFNAGTGRIVNVPADVGGWPTLAAGSAPTDSDSDGMPNAWEQQRGLNPNDATDGRQLASNGYTNLENYLNGL